MNIKKEHLTLTERGVPENSHFEITLSDGSVHNESTTNWSDISTQIVVEFFGKQKTVFVCSHPVSKIKITHGRLESEIDIPSDCQVYQAIRSSSSLVSNGTTHATTIGRVVGLVKNGSVIEERFLDTASNKIIGIR